MLLEPSSARCPATDLSRGSAGAAMGDVFRGRDTDLSR